MRLILLTRDLKLFQQIRSFLLQQTLPKATDIEMDLIQGLQLPRTSWNEKWTITKIIWSIVGISIFIDLRSPRTSMCFFF